MVVRQIAPGTAEFRSAPGQKALNDELQRLRKGEVWDESTVEEWTTVQRRHPDAVCGRLFGILGQKHSEMAGAKPQDKSSTSSTPDAPYKGRIVMAGNNLQTGDGREAYTLFTEVSGPPATMTAARLGIATAALLGHSVTVRDAESAYIQARIDGEGRCPTFVRLPPWMMPDSWFVNQNRSMPCRFRDPVCRLRRALYGHPESGALWEKTLDEVVRKLGFKKVEAWPGTYHCEEHSALLIVYVDDLLLICPKAVEAGIWSKIEGQIRFKDPPLPINRYLGVHHKLTSSKGTTSLVVQMQDFILSAVTRYETETKLNLPFAATPYLEADTPTTTAEGEEGAQKATCASHLMKLLFAARMSAPWLCVGIQKLASFVSKWTRFHDKALHKLMSFCKHNAALQLTSSLSEADRTTVELHFYPDADLAGDKATTKSTSGLWVELASKDGLRFWPLAWGSKKQTSTASSTCEAESISLSTGLRREVIPCLDLIELVLGRKVSVITHEDNSAAIQCIAAGYSPALRHLNRTARVSLGFLHEIYHSGTLASQTKLVHCATNRMKADFLTKPLARQAFDAALSLINVK